MMWIIFAVLLSVILFIIYKHDFFRLPGLARLTPILFFTFKIAAGLCIWAIYTFYYPDRQYADIWKYYDDSEIIYNAAAEHPGDYAAMISGIGIDERIDSTYFRKMNHWHQQFENNLFNDSHTIIRFNAIVRLFSAGNYHTHSLVMCLLAFIGLCALYKWIYPFLFQWKKVVAFILFISPSLLFWSSGVLKEGILFFSLGLLIYHSWKFMDDRKYGRLFIIAIALFLLAITKLYMLAFVTPALITGVWLHLRPRFAAIKVLATLAVVFAISLSIHYAVPAFSPYKIIANKQNDFLNLARGGTYLVSTTRVTYLRPDQHDKLVQIGRTDEYKIAEGTDYYCWNIADNFADTIFVRNNSDTAHHKILSDNPVAGSLLNVEPLKPVPASVFKNIPQALATTLLRPWPWEFKPVMIIPSVFENLLFYAILIAFILRKKKTSAQSILWFCLLFSFLTLIVIGLTTPVLGAIVRYRITALPFLMFAILLCTDRDSLLKRLPFLRKLI